MLCLVRKNQTAAAELVPVYCYPNPAVAVSALGLTSVLLSEDHSNRRRMLDVGLASKLVSAMSHKALFVRSSAGIVAMWAVNDPDMLHKLRNLEIVGEMLQVVVQRQLQEKTLLPLQPYLWPVLQPGSGNPMQTEVSYLTDPASVMCCALAKLIGKAVQIAQQIPDLRPAREFMSSLLLCSGSARRAEMLLLSTMLKGAWDPQKRAFCEALAAAGFYEKVCSWINRHDELLTAYTLDALTNWVSNTVGTRGLPPVGSAKPSLPGWSSTSHLAVTT